MPAHDRNGPATSDPAGARLTRRQLAGLGGSIGVIGSVSGCLDGSDDSDGSGTTAAAGETESISGTPTPDPIDPSPTTYDVDARATRVNRYVEVTSVIDGDTVDVGWPDHHPKEPASFVYDGTYYVACAIWESYANSETDTKEVVLCRSDRPDGGFEQISQVTDQPGSYDHAPALHVTEDGECWVFWSNFAGGGPSVDARHAPVGEIPATPEGWTDEGTVVDHHKDPGLHRADDGTFYMFANDSRSEWPSGEIHRLSSSNLVDWENQTLVYSHPTDGHATEASDVIPKATGDGWWITFAKNTRGKRGGWIVGAGEADALTDTFTGSTTGTTGTAANGIQHAYNDDWNSHVDYLKRDASTQITRSPDGRDCLAYLETGSGDQYHVSFARLREPQGSRFELPAEQSVGQAAGDGSAPALLAYYPFDSGEGSSVSDRIADESATLEGVSWTDGYTGPGLSFDPSSDAHVALPGSLSVEGSVTSLIVAEFDAFPTEGPAWIASSGYDGQRASWEWKLLPNGHLKFGSFTADGDRRNHMARVKGGVLHANYRYVLVGRYDGETWDVFGNGRRLPAIGSGADVGAVQTDGTPTIGAHDDDGERIGFFDGTIECFALWDGALTDDQIAAIQAGFDESDGSD
jgi:hypothetical protein